MQDLMLRVIDPNSTQGISGVLCWFRLLTNGTPFYEGTAGVTDAGGRVCVQGVEIEKWYEEDKKLFPMDYRTPLTAADDTVDAYVLGGKRFLELKRQIASNPLTAPEARTQFDVAVNCRLPFDYRAASVELGREGVIEIAM